MTLTAMRSSANNGRGEQALKGLSQLTDVGMQRLKEAALELQTVGVTLGGRDTVVSDFARGQEVAKLDAKLRSIPLIFHGPQGEKPQDFAGPLGETQEAGKKELQSQQLRTVWELRQQQNERVLLSMIDNAIQENFRDVANEYLNEMQSEWEEEQAVIDEAQRGRGQVGLTSPAPITSSLRGHHRRGAPDLQLNAVVQQQQQQDMPPEERLFLQHLESFIRCGPDNILAEHATKIPITEFLARLAEFSVAAVDLPPYLAETPGFQDDILHIWAILLGICGVESKANMPPVAALELLMWNSLRRLEKDYVDEMKSSLQMTAGTHNTASFEALSADEKLAELTSCAISTFGIDESDRAMMLNICWAAFRAGFLDVLELLAKSAEMAHVGGRLPLLPSLASANRSGRYFAVSETLRPPAGYDCLCRLLAHRLLVTTQSLTAVKDDPAKCQTITLGEAETVGAPQAADKKRLLAQLRQVRPLQTEDDITEHPLGGMLLALVDPSYEIPAVTYAIPGCSTQDFIVAHMHRILLEHDTDRKLHSGGALTGDSTPGSLAAALHSLQEKFVDAGPQHFLDSKSGPLDYVKVLLRILRPTEAIEYLVDAYPVLRRLSLQIIFYLYAFGVIGQQQVETTPEGPPKSATVGVVTSMIQIPFGCPRLNLGDCVAELLKGETLRMKLPYIALLPYSEKTPVVSELLEDEILMEQDEGSAERLLGTISEEGYLQPGELFTLIAAENKIEEDVIKLFKQVCARFATSAETKENYLAAIRAHFFTESHTEVIKLLIAAFCNVHIFPAISMLDGFNAQIVQEEIFRYYRTIENMCADARLDPETVSDELLEMLRFCFKVAVAFTLVEENRLIDAIRYIEDHGLVPLGREDLTSWRSLPPDVLPRLIDAYVFSIYEASRKGLLRDASARYQLEDTAHRLLDLCHIIEFEGSIYAGIQSRCAPETLERLREMVSYATR